MNKKSKVITFFLSFLPGLSHVYLGVLDRAFIFFLLFFGSIIGALGMSFITHEEIFIFGLGIALPIIWLIALVDAISLTDKIAYEEGKVSENRPKAIEKANQKLIAVMLSVVPGAGHMYLGLMMEGLFFMTTFFLTIFFMSWLNLSLFLFLLPIIWFYSLFDALHSTEEEKPKYSVDSYVISWIEKNPNLIGWGLISLGCVVFLERIVSPFLTWQIKSHIKTGIVALIFIASGVKLILGPKDTPEESYMDIEEKQKLQNTIGEEEK